MGGWGGGGNISVFQVNVLCPFPLTQAQLTNFWGVIQSSNSTIGMQSQLKEYSSREDNYESSTSQCDNLFHCNLLH